MEELDQRCPGVKEHIRYPNTMLRIQADVYKRYHVNDITVFFQGEDRWDIAREKVGASEEESAMTPNYYMIKMPGEENIEFVNSIPYTPKDRPNMIALLVARNDGANYGELVLYRLPKGRTIMGPSQIDAQISQNTQISQDFALWENSGSTYSRGNMFVIPIKDSIMYVEPIYLKSTASAIPEVKRVIVYYNEKIAYEETLAEALNTMFGPGVGDQAASPISGSGITGGTGGKPIPPPDTGTTPPPDTGTTKPPDTGTTQPPDTGTTTPPGTDLDNMTTEQLIIAAQEAFDRGEKALRNGDWAAYGEAQDELNAILKKLAELNTQ
jgi:uncharacterized membrane protein (UPF0182 family)